MNSKSFHADARAQADQIAERLFRLLVVDTDAAFDRHRNRNRASRIAATHSATRCGSCIRHAPKRPDCTRSEGQPTLRLISAVTEFFTDLRGFGELHRLRSTDLQRHRIFAAVETEKLFLIAAQNRIRRHHLGVEQGTAA